MDENQYIDTKEAATILHKTPQSLRNDRYLKRGIDYYKLGKKVLYLREDIHLFILKSKVTVS